MVVGNVALGKTVPPLLGSGCDLVARTDARLWGGFPVGIVGLATIGAILTLTLHRRSLPFAKSVACASAGYAVWLQIRVAALLQATCAWCVLTTAFLVLGALALLFARTPWRLSRAPALLLGAALPMLLAGFVPAPIPPAEILPLPSINRAQITGHSDSSRREIVVFASPECPECRTEVPALLRRFPLDKTLVLRFAPLNGSRDERRLAALARLAADARRPDLLKILFSGELLNVRTGFAERALAPTNAALRAAYSAVDADALSARALKVATIPFVAECPPDSACRKVDPSDL